MPTETKGRPYPTPHPDEPRKPPPTELPSPEPGPELQPFEHTDPDAPASDSYFDDLDLHLAQPVSDPDPALRSNATSDEAVRLFQSDVFGSSGSLERVKPPKTAELFTKLAPQAAGADDPPAEAGSCELPSSGEALSAAACELAGQSGPAEPSAKPPGRAGSRENVPDDDRLADSRIAWLIILLLSYASALTIALAWILWTGHGFHAAEEAAARASQPGVEAVAKTADAAQPSALPSIPDENVTSLGRPIRLGAVEFTPLEIVAGPLQLVRSIDSSDVRDEETDSLIMRCKLTNISNELSFAPLEQAFLREQSSPLDRARITTGSGQRINLFPLAVDSEWSIAGQSFPVLGPGESTETLIASEPIPEGRPTGQLTWRLRLRIGLYRSDLIGVRFTGGDIMP